ncbi:hypothetical protein L2729_18910 [Shewanella gelidimarina]|uniref:hypothetical protein n=1 Tax=Shewanella gelidimarina TaxID=56813 RepID=UPI00200E806B|nr:hypothetical protein [Shewanella gelidimarina]MCL1060044.1 hypothetical protein [Shewanella gelidimarina]
MLKLMNGEEVIITIDLDEPCDLAIGLAAYYVLQLAKRIEPMYRPNAWVLTALAC